MSDTAIIYPNDVYRIYQGSDGEATKRLYAQLETYGPVGGIAVNLFRAQKASERAKVYRGGGYRGMAYDKKQWSMDLLAKALTAFAGYVPLDWGWGVDDKHPYHRHVLYVDLLTGQVSFHTDRRGEGPDYARGWDGQPGQSADRICRWIARLIREASLKPPRDAAVKAILHG